MLADFFFDWYHVSYPFRLDFSVDIMRFHVDLNFRKCRQQAIMFGCCYSKTTQLIREDGCLEAAWYLFSLPQSGSQRCVCRSPTVAATRCVPTTMKQEVCKRLSLAIWTFLPHIKYLVCSSWIRAKHSWFWVLQQVCALWRSWGADHSSCMCARDLLLFRVRRSVIARTWFSPCLLIQGDLIITYQFKTGVVFNDNCFLLHLGDHHSRPWRVGVKITAPNLLQRVLQCPQRCGQGVPGVSQNWFHMACVAPQDLPVRYRCSILRQEAQ